MHDETEFGPEIAVDGLPDWVGPDEVIMGKWEYDGWYDGGSTWASCYAFPDRITAIRLRADHAYYVARSIGSPKRQTKSWITKEEFPEFYPEKWAVNGEMPASLPDSDDDYVRVKRMTRSEIDKAIKDCDYDIEMLLYQLGISKEDSVVEQFEREHGGLDNNQRDIVEAFIAWQSRNG